MGSSGSMLGTEDASESDPASSAQSMSSLNKNAIRRPVRTVDHLGPRIEALLLWLDPLSVCAFVTLLLVILDVVDA